MPTPSNLCCPPTDPDDHSGPAIILTYIDDSLGFYNIYRSMYMTLNGFSYVDPDTGQIYSLKDVMGKCVRTQDAPVGYGKIYDPIPCPCCPDDYTYLFWRTTDSSSISTPCISNLDLHSARPSDLIVYLAPVQCIECVCPDPLPPPECEGCVNPALPVAFHFSEATKTCEECGTDSSPRVMGQKKYDNFLAYNLVDTVIVFKRR